MKKQQRSVSYGPVFNEGYRSFKHMRWVENAGDGLRLVGFADKIIRLRHTGWFTDDDGMGDTFRGVVYQLPSRKGQPLYAYGYADPNNDGCALLCFDVTNDKEEAARFADQVAETLAESEREYNRAWQAARRHETLAEEIGDMRREALAIGAEMRGARGKVEAPTICATLRAKVFSLYRNIQRARKEQAELLANFGRQPGWEA